MSTSCSDVIEVSRGRARLAVFPLTHPEIPSSEVFTQYAVLASAVFYSHSHRNGTESNAVQAMRSLIV